MSYMLSYTWRVGEYWKAVGPSLSVWTQSHVMSSLEVAWSVVDSIYKFSDYSSVQHAPCCRLHHLQTEGKTKMEKKKKKKDDKRGRAAVRYSSCQAGTGSEECVGKNNHFSGESGYCWCRFCCVVSVLFGPTVSVFVHCTIPESMEACFLVVLGGGGGGVLLGKGGGTCLWCGGGGGGVEGLVKSWLSSRLP